MHLFIESLEISPREVKVGDTVSIKAKVTDDLSGVRNVDMFLAAPSTKNGRPIQLFDQDKDGIWEGFHKIGNV